MFNDIDYIEGMEEIPKDTWEDKFCEAVEDLQREGVRPEGSKDSKNGGDEDNNRDGVKKKKKIRNNT